MNTIGLQELKKIQLDVLDVIHGFCIEHDIQYSLGCGTMLGAVRHKGYIPWDDDIDIYLLRSEYNKLLELYPRSLAHVQMDSLERNSSWDKAYAKAYDERTVCVEDSNCKVVGVSIDIFPIDYVPSNEKQWERYNKRRRMLKIISDLKPMKVTDNMSLLKKLLLVVCKILLLPIPQRLFISWLNGYAQKFNKTEHEYVFESCQGLLLKNKFKASVFDQFIDVPFEDRKYKIIADYDEYLRCAYGDYMQLPPENKRVSHHSFKAWWK